MQLEYISNILIILYIFSIFILIWKRNDGKLLDYTFSLILAVSISEGLKYLINAPRPDNIYQVEGSSFPSTHSAIVSNGLFFYLLVCNSLIMKEGRGLFHFKKHLNVDKRQYYILISLTVIAVTVMTLRVVMQVHTIIDVIGGIMIGLFSVLPFVYYDVSGRRLK